MAYAGIGKQIADGVRGYVADVVRLDVSNDVVRQEIFARQLEATTSAVRWLSPVMVLVTALTTLLFWDGGNKLLLLTGQLIVCATCIKSLRSLPQRISIEDARHVARLHIGGALMHGLGISMVSIGVMFDQGVHTAMFISCWHVAFISVGLGFYVNLPIAFLAYSLPISVPFVTPFLLSNDRTIIIGPFLLIYLCVLARIGVDQNRMFVAAGRNALRLREAETAARTAAEERMERVEQVSASTRAAEEARRSQMLALAERFEHTILTVADLLSNTVEGLDGSAKQMADVTRYSASTAQDVAVRMSDAAGSMATVAVAANDLALAIAAITAQIEDHAQLSGRATCSAVDSEKRVAMMFDEAKHVSGMVTLIKNVTAQTKLLALNASIEAARAGETGRGFSVVAQEVKTLADRAGDATHDITAQVDSILSRIDPTLASIQSTAHEIDGVAVIANSIASSITQQRMASEQIDRETDTAARHVNDIRSRMAELAEQANHAGSLTDGVSSAAEQVARQANSLQSAAADFLRELRAA